MFNKVLIANRGAIACRIIRTLKRLRVGAVAVYSDADRNSLHVAQADQSVGLGPGPAAEPYLRQDKLLAAARATSAEAIHPGCGFFSESGLFLEKYNERARLIEVQIVGDGAGQVIALGERDCSAQRRNQKLIEETPAPGLSEALRQRLVDSAIRLGKAVNYQSAGTVEFVFDAATEGFYFLEIHNRLQGEHRGTEEVTGPALGGWV